MYKIRINRQKKSIRILHVDRNIKIQSIERRVIIRGKSKRGLPGPPGPGGIDKNYVQSFTNSAEVIVNHSLNKRPAISIEDTAGDEVEGHVEFVNTNTIIVRFSSSFSGRVICN